MWALHVYEHLKIYIDKASGWKKIGKKKGGGERGGYVQENPDV